MREELKKFPVLRPASGWTEDAVWDRTQAFFEKKGTGITAGVLAQTSDVESMGRYLRTSIRHYLVSEARKTPIGAVRRKIEELLTGTAEFIQVPAGQPGAGRWQLAGEAGTPYAGELRPLVVAAYGVANVRAVRWSGSRRAPLASDQALIDILCAVLTQAGGSLEVGQLTAVFLQRFPAAIEQADASLDDRTHERAFAPLDDHPDVVADISERALEVYDQLSPSQRALMPHLNKPVADQMEVLGVGRSQAYEAAKKLKAALVELVPDDELRMDVGLEVLRLCLINP